MLLFSPEQKNPDIEVPGLEKEDNIEVKEVRDRVLMAIGRWLGVAFKTDIIQIDNIKCTRLEARDDGQRKDVKSYFFEICAHDTDFCAHGAPMDAPIETFIAPNAPEETQHSHYIDDTHTHTSKEKFIRVRETSGAMGADGCKPGANEVAYGSRWAQCGFEACRICNQLAADGHCKQYGKPAMDVQHCWSKERHSTPSR